MVDNLFCFTFPPTKHTVSKLNPLSCRDHTSDMAHFTFCNDNNHSLKRLSHTAYLVAGDMYKIDTPLLREISVTKLDVVALQSFEHGTWYKKLGNWLVYGPPVINFELCLFPSERWSQYTG